MIKRSVIFVCLILIVGFAGISSADHHAVKISTKPGLVHYLTDAKGMTLYWFKKDSEGKSACAGECLVNWPIYHRDNVAAPKGIDPNDFATITREDGEKQTTFRGFPLYYFSKDASPGDTAGHGLRDVWFAVDPINFPPK